MRSPPPFTSAMKSGTFSMLPISMEHLDDLLVGPAVARAVQRGRGRGRRRVGVGVRGADDPHGGGRAVLLVVGVQDEQHVERMGEHGVGLEAGLGDLPHHREEVGAEVERVVRVDEGHADAEAVGGCGEGRHLRDQPDDLLLTGLLVEDALGVQVEGGKRGDGGDEHAHRVGVVVEALEEPLSYVLVDERVVRDLAASTPRTRSRSGARPGGGGRPPRGRSSPSASCSIG